MMDIATVKHDLSDVLTEYFDKVQFPKTDFLSLAAVPAPFRVIGWELTPDWILARLSFQRWRNFYFPEIFTGRFKAASTLTGHFWLNDQLLSSTIWKLCRLSRPSTQAAALKLQPTRGWMIRLKLSTSPHLAELILVARRLGCMSNTFRFRLE